MCNNESLQNCQEIYLICSGIRLVYVSTQQNGTHDNEYFQLTTGEDTLLLHGVLCENGGDLIHISHKVSAKDLQEIKMMLCITMFFCNLLVTKLSI